MIASPADMALPRGRPSWSSSTSTRCRAVTAAPGLDSGALGDQLWQLMHNRADAHRSRRGVQVAGSPESAADVLLMGPDVEGAQQHHGRGLVRTEWPGDDAGVRQHRIPQRLESLCQKVLELGENLRAGAPPTYLHCVLHLLAEVVPDVLVRRHLDPG